MEKVEDFEIVFIIEIGKYDDENSNENINNFQNVLEKVVLDSICIVEKSVQKELLEKE